MFATLAFHWSGRSNRFPDQLAGPVAPHRVQKLYHTSADFTLPGRQPITLPPATAIVEIGNYLETKIKAFRAHTSQQPLWPLFEEYMRKRGGRELFHLAAAVNAGSVQPESDLFAGVS